jgi:endoglucanase
MCERLGISWVCWSISDKNESCSMLLPRATATGPWSDDVIKEYGKLVKGLLKKYNR